ncbi:MAG TPA: alpha/beta hydrolase [Candidatus Binataceae bacterium]|nr:alpha/beta hydrolase [Candidatus Binataceae bacterium]
MADTKTVLIPTRHGEIELYDEGGGPPLLFLHCGEGLRASLPLLDRLARGRRVVAASHPGFGRSALPPHFGRIDDLAYFYLDLLAVLDLRDVLLVGASFGGWIAIEIAVRSTDRLARMVVADAVGVRFAADETEVEIADIYDLPQAVLEQRSFVHPMRWRPDFSLLSDDALMTIARNREALCLYAWAPYMHNPGLRPWLHRIALPALVLWGESDGIVSPDYGRALAAALPDARFLLVEGAAHYPHIEQTERFASLVEAFATEEGTR